MNVFHFSSRSSVCPNFCLITLNFIVMCFYYKFPKFSLVPIRMAHGLSHEMPSPAQNVRSWVRILTEARASAPLFFRLCVVMCREIQRSEFDSRRHQIFWEAVGLERGPFSLVSTIEELLQRKSNGSGLEIRDYGRRESTVLTTRHLSIRKSWH
jgi:hypothetical protein